MSERRLEGKDTEKTNFPDSFAFDHNMSFLAEAARTCAEAVSLIAEASK
jgi:hypothetical protein